MVNIAVQAAKSTNRTLKNTSNNSDTTEDTEDTNNMMYIPIVLLILLLSYKLVTTTTTSKFTSLSFLLSSIIIVGLSSTNVSRSKTYNAKCTWNSQQKDPQNCSYVESHESDSTNMYILISIFSLFSMISVYKFIKHQALDDSFLKAKNRLNALKRK